MKEQSEPVVDGARIREGVAAVAPEKPDAAEPETVKVAQPPKSLSVRLSGAQPEEFLELRAWATPSGWRSDVAHWIGKKSTRGATAEHADIEAARAAVEKLAADAVKAGWRRGTRSGGFARKPDEFGIDSLPRPAASTGAKGKAKK